MFIKKKTEWINLTFSILAAFIMIAAINSVNSLLITVILCLVYGLVVLEIVKCASTYDISKFEYKHTSREIFIGGVLFGILGGLIVYFLIKYKEDKINEKI